MEYVALGAAPGIAICLIIFYRDLYNKEPIQNLIISFILGCLAILPAMGFETSLSSVNNGTTSGIALFAYCVVGFSEEFSKFLGLRLYSYNQKAFNEPLDGIVYAVIVSMGFATVENVMYALKFQDMKSSRVANVPKRAGTCYICYHHGIFCWKSKIRFKKQLCPYAYRLAWCYFLPWHF